MHNVVQLVTGSLWPGLRKRWISHTMKLILRFNWKLCWIRIGWGSQQTWQSNHWFLTMQLIVQVLKARAIQRNGHEIRVWKCISMWNSHRMFPRTRLNAKKMQKVVLLYWCKICIIQKKSRNLRKKEFLINVANQWHPIATSTTVMGKKHDAW